MYEEYPPMTQTEYENAPWNEEDLTTVSITMSKSFNDDVGDHFMIPELLDILINLASEKAELFPNSYGNYYKQVVKDCENWIEDEFVTI